MNRMDRVTESRLAQSLTAEDISLIPYLPYLLQDLWELGSDPDTIIRMLGTLENPQALHILDLGCGKGAVGIQVARALGCRVKGIDLLPDFIRCAREKAAQWDVSGLCSFETGDAKEAVKTQRGYDVVIWGAVGRVLGEPVEMLAALKDILKPRGHMVLDDAWREGEASLRFDCGYPTREEWMRLFADNGLQVLEECIFREDGLKELNDGNNRAIAARAAELIERYPQKRDIFEAYVRSQQAESDDLLDGIVGATWLLELG